MEGIVFLLAENVLYKMLDWLESKYVFSFWEQDFIYVVDLVITISSLLMSGPVRKLLFPFTWEKVLFWNILS